MLLKLFIESAIAVSIICACYAAISIVVDATRCIAIVVFIIFSILSPFLMLLSFVLLPRSHLLYVCRNFGRYQW